MTAQEQNKMMVDSVRLLNQALNFMMSSELSNKGINQGRIVGGLNGVECSEQLCFESNLKNLLAAFQHNYAESIGFQVDSIKQRRNILLVTEYLTTRGLLEDFERFWMEK